MTAPAVSVPLDTTLPAAVGSLLDHRIGSVLVIDQGLVGIVTRSDVLRAVYHLEPPLSSLKVSDAMTEDVVTTTESTTSTTALRTMERHQIKKLPVMEDLDVVGIVTMTDIAEHQPDRVREVRGAFERKDEWTD